MPLVDPAAIGGIHSERVESDVWGGEVELRALTRAEYRWYTEQDWEGQDPDLPLLALGWVAPVIPGGSNPDDEGAFAERVAFLSTAHSGEVWRLALEIVRISGLRPGSFRSRRDSSGGSAAGSGSPDDDG